MPTPARPPAPSMSRSAQQPEHTDTPLKWGPLEILDKVGRGSYGRLCCASALPRVALKLRGLRTPRLILRLAEYYVEAGRSSDATRVADDARRLLAVADPDHPLLSRLQRLPAVQLP